MLPFPLGLIGVTINQRGVATSGTSLAYQSLNKTCVIYDVAFLIFDVFLFLKAAYISCILYIS